MLPWGVTEGPLSRVPFGVVLRWGQRVFLLSPFNGSFEFNVMLVGRRTRSYMFWGIAADL